MDDARSSPGRLLPATTAAEARQKGFEDAVGALLGQRKVLPPKVRKALAVPKRVESDERGCHSSAVIRAQALRLATPLHQTVHQVLVGKHTQRALVGLGRQRVEDGKIKVLAACVEVLLGGNCRATPVTLI